MRTIDRWALLGLSIMIVSESATLAGIEPFASWNTPIAWTGFIIFADAVVYRARRDSWLRSAPREFAWLALASVPLWIVFEGYNLVINNWYYTGLPENFWLRQFGYAWSFATIWPAIFEGAELTAVARERIGGGSVVRERVRLKADTATASALPAPPAVPAPPARPALPAPPALLIAAGIAMLVVPFVVPASVAVYLAAPVWLGFIFLLDPLNRRLGGEGLTYDRVVNLSGSGLLCGILWEFWNYWAHAKWHYTVPIMERVKLFEMPLPGYLGFPAFAIECFTMYVFVRTVLQLTPPRARQLGRTIAL